MFALAGVQTPLSSGMCDGAGGQEGAPAVWDAPGREACVAGLADSTRECALHVDDENSEVDA